MAWVKSKNIVRLQADINAVAPTRDKKSDGTIGDEAHQLSPSGHNPDDKPGSKAEAQDSDNISEVRAVDIDKDFNHPTLTGGRLVQAVLNSPRDRKRFLYIIWNRTIWTKSGGWNPQAYHGSNAHTEHVHLSGDPDYDEDDAPYESILEFDMLDAKRDTPIIQSAIHGTPIGKSDRTLGMEIEALRPVPATVKGVQAQVQVLTDSFAKFVAKYDAGMAAEIQRDTAEAAREAARDQAELARDQAQDAKLAGLPKATADLVNLGEEEPPEMVAAKLKAFLGPRAKAVFEAGLSTLSTPQA